ncbi:MAG TPA: hypothetical protein PKD83_11530 [Ignavibacteria bacterium]|nr:hypothetical protein [Ignavibacteria bacterium]
MKTKLIIVFCLFTVFLNQSYGQQDVNGWYWLNGKPTGNWINWVQIIDAANIYAVGNRGTFMKSTDGGDTWALNSQVGSLNNDPFGGLSHLSLYTGYFFNANTGIVAGQSLPSDVGTISKTTDGGVTWNKYQYSGAGSRVYGLSFTNSLTGYIAGTDNAKFLKTTNGGLNWVNKAVGAGFPNDNFKAVNAIDTGNIFLISNDIAQRVYHYTTASGWTTMNLPGSFTVLTDIIFKDANTGYVCGNPNYFAYTTNAGSGWNVSNVVSAEGMNDLTYSGGVLYMAGNYEYYYKSTNNGINWTSVYFRDLSNPNQPPLNSPAIIYGISVNGNDHVVVGQDGIVNISNDGGSSWRNKNYSVTNNFGAYNYSSMLVQTTGSSNPATVGNIWLGPEGGGNVLFSSNAGTNWVTKPTPNLASVHGIQFPNSLTGYICGGNSFQGIGEMSKTTNGGNNWTALGLPTPMNSTQINGMSFVNATTGWIGGSTGSCLKTTNGGSSWAVQTLETNPPYILSIGMINASTGYILGNTLYSTTNGGTNWIKNTSSYLSSVQFWIEMFVMSKDIIYLCGYGDSNGEKLINRSTDGGITWTDLTSNLIIYPELVVFNTSWLNLKHGVISATSGLTATTTNGGLNWTASNPGGSTTVDVAMPSKNEIFTVSDRTPGTYSVWRKNNNLTSISLNLTMLIQGFWNGTSMIPDTVNVELRNSTFPYALVDQSKEVVNSKGYATYEFYNAPSGSYYIVLKQRNSLETWSSVPVTMNAAGNYYYDFTTSASQAFGNNTILKSGLYCDYSGDVNQDGIVDAGDLALIENEQGNSGYLPEDLTGDDFVDGSDISLVENNQGVAVVQP